MIRNGGSAFLNGKDFTEPLERESERMTFDFLIENFEKHLNVLKPHEETLKQSTSEGAPQITSIEAYNQRNLDVLQLDEMAVLEKNLDYLYKTRKANVFEQSL